MNRQCPNCYTLGRVKGFTVPVRYIGVKNAVGRCPGCDVGFIVNRHCYEKLLIVPLLILLPTIVSLYLMMKPIGTQFFMAVAATILVTLIFSIRLFTKIPKNWNRYTVFCVFPRYLDSFQPQSEEDLQEISTRIHRYKQEQRNNLKSDEFWAFCKLNKIIKGKGK